MSEYSKISLNVSPKLFKENTYFIYKLLILVPSWFLIFFLTNYFSNFTNSFSVRLLFCFLLSLISVQLGIISHDGGHRAISKKKWVNDFWGHWGMTLINGLNFTFWRKSHNSHHSKCQEEEFDPDMQFNNILALYRKARINKNGFFDFLLRYQYIYFWFLLPLHSFSLRWESIVYALKNFKKYPFDFFILCLHYILWLGILLFWLPLSNLIINYLICSLIIGLILQSIFAINHIGRPSIADGLKIDNIKKQIETSRNIIVPNWLHFYFGGLNFHIEHHLFPTIGHGNLKKIQPIVKGYCTANNLHYHEVSYFKAIQEIYAQLLYLSKLNLNENRNKKVG